MKKCVIVLTLLLLFNQGQAQTFKEWFRQKKTRIEYLVNQIAALQVYIEFVQKGYKIVDQGLTTIGRIKKGDWDLHTDFLNVLKAVNPKIRNSAQVAGIIALQIKIVQVQKSALKKVQQSDYLNEKEISYLVQVYTRLLEQSIDNIEELTTLITTGQYELSDDERIERIDILYVDMQEKHQFLQWFTGQTDVLIATRKQDRRETNILQLLIPKNK